MLLRVRPAPLAAVLKRLFRMSRIEKEVPGGRFSIDPVSVFGFALLTRGEYEPGMLATLRTWLRPGGTFVDLGANEGYFSVLAAHLVGETGRVLAIEPQNRLLPVIAENFRLNGVRNAAVAKVAVSDRSGSATLYLPPNTNTGGGGLDRATRYRVPTQEVTVVTLGDLLEQHGIAQVDLIKIDIEGFEYEAVLGSPDLFRQHRFKAIALELHPSALERRGKSGSEIEGFLTRAGYALDRRSGHAVWVVAASAAA